MTGSGVVVVAGVGLGVVAAWSAERVALEPSRNARAEMTTRATSRTLNPAGIILGGELGTAGQPLVDGARESINRYAQPAMAEAVEIRTAALGLRSEVLGAIATASQAALYLTEAP